MWGHCLGPGHPGELNSPMGHLIPLLPGAAKAEEHTADRSPAWSDNISPSHPTTSSGVVFVMLAVSTLCFFMRHCSLRPEVGTGEEHQ